MLVRPQLQYASEDCNPYAMKCIKKIEQIQRNSCRFIFHEYRRDNDTSLLINRLNLDSLYTRRLIQQATMFCKIYICPPSYIQHANHISSRTDHPMKYCNKNPLQINAYEYYFFPCSMNICNHLPCSAVSHVTPSVDYFHKFVIPAIRVMVLLSFKFQYEFFFFFFLPIVNNSVLFTSYLCIFFLLVVLVFSYSSIPAWLVIRIFNIT